MRHLKAGRKLNRTSSHRKALFRNLAAALFHHESIKTTNPKALELRRVADRLISLAKSGGTHAARHAFAILRDKEAVKKLFSDIGMRYSGINGGYTRVLKIGCRKGDAAPMALVELTQKRGQKEQEKGQKKEVRKEQEKGQKKEAKEGKPKKPAQTGRGKKEQEKGEKKEPKEAKAKKATQKTGRKKQAEAGED
jgi:large subunit ribosomal protein L17